MKTERYERGLNKMAMRTAVGWDFRPDQNMVLMQAIGAIPAVESQCELTKEWLNCWAQLGAKEQGEVTPAW